MGKYILIGVPSCGKTTLGKAVAKKLELPFFDTDEMTIKSLNLNDPIEQFFYSNQVRFYHGQYDVVKQLEVHTDPAIIATGAEVALMPQCAPLLKKMGTVIYIKRRVEDIIKEVEERERAQGRRMVVSVNDGEAKSMRVESVKLYAEEVSQYEEVADVILKNDASEDEAVSRLSSIIEQMMGC